MSTIEAGASSNHTSAHHVTGPLASSSQIGSPAPRTTPPPQQGTPPPQTTPPQQGTQHGTPPQQTIPRRPLITPASQSRITPLVIWASTEPAARAIRSDDTDSEATNCLNL